MTSVGEICDTHCHLSSGPRIVCLLAEMNGFKLTGGDVGNAYLEACALEKVCVCAGPEFGPLEGHSLVIEKAL